MPLGAVRASLNHKSALGFYLLRIGKIVDG